MTLREETTLASQIVDKILDAFKVTENGFIKVDKRDEAKVMIKELCEKEEVNPDYIIKIMKHEKYKVF